MYITCIESLKIDKNRSPVSSFILTGDSLHNECSGETTWKNRSFPVCIVGQPGPWPGANLETLWYVAARVHPRTLYFSETRRQGASNAGSIMDSAWCMLEQHETFYIFFKNCMRVLWERFDWIFLIFLKSYFKKWISGRHNWKISRTQRIRPALRR